MKDKETESEKLVKQQSKNMEIFTRLPERYKPIPESILIHLKKSLEEGRKKTSRRTTKGK